jgi:hypothetical protein
MVLEFTHTPYEDVFYEQGDAPEYSRAEWFNVRGGCVCVVRVHQHTHAFAYVRGCTCRQTDRQTVHQPHHG